MMAEKINQKLIPLIIAMVFMSCKRTASPTTRAPPPRPGFDNSNYIPGNREKVINSLLWFYYFNAVFSFCSNSMVTCCGLLDLVKLSKIHSL